MTRTILSRDFQLLESIPPISIPEEEISNIEYPDNDAESNNKMRIFLKDKNVYLIEDYIGPADAWGPDFSRVRLMRLKPKDDYEIRFVGDGKSYFGRNIIGVYLVKSGYIYNQYMNEKDILFENTSEYSKKALDRIKWYRHDWSICLALRTKH
jgi:hypothetical protein